MLNIRLLLLNFMEIATIVLAEKEETFVLKFKLLLKRVGINTQYFKHFKTTDETWDYIVKDISNFPLCFIDVNLSGILTTTDLISNIKKLNKDIKIGIISRADSQIAYVTVKKIGADFFMSKNGSYQDLERRLNNFKNDFYLNTPTSDFYLYE